MYVGFVVGYFVVSGFDGCSGGRDRSFENCLFLCVCVCKEGSWIIDGTDTKTIL